MTTIQRTALDKMGGAGSIRVNGKWIWREDVRNSEATAREVLEWAA